MRLINSIITLNSLRIQFKKQFIKALLFKQMVFWLFYFFYMWKTLYVAILTSSGFMSLVITIKIWKELDHYFELKYSELIRSEMFTRSTPNKTTTKTALLWDTQGLQSIHYKIVKISHVWFSRSESLCFLFFKSF